MERNRTALIGLVEAGLALGGRSADIVGYDRKRDAEPDRQTVLDRTAAAEITTADSNAGAVRGSSLILSLVTADQALAAPRETAEAIAPGALFCDMNSVAPDTKRQAAAIVEGAGGRYVDVAGVRAEVVASLDASWPGADWGRRFDYNLDRMMVHGRRRADELDEVVATLDALGTGSAMSRGTAQRQRAIGALGLAPPNGLDPKLDALLPLVRSVLKDAA